MAEASESTPTEDAVPMVWGLSNRRSRKSGCSNIFTGLNVHQLHRLFRTAGDRDAEHRAKLVWRGMDPDRDGPEDEKEMEDREEEAGLAQALVGLRVRARNKVGLRAEAPRDHKWLRPSSYLRIGETFSDYSVADEDVGLPPSPEEFASPAEEEVRADRNPFKPSSWRLGGVRQEGTLDTERYLHRILH